jgi:hypothetical protein
MGEIDLEPHVMQLLEEANDSLSTTEQFKLQQSFDKIKQVLEDRKAGTRALKQKRNELKYRIVLEVSSDEPDEEHAWFPPNYVPGFVVKKDALHKQFVPNLKGRSDWANQCNAQWMTVSGRQHLVQGQDDAVQTRLMAAAQSSCLFCIRNTLLDGGDVRALDQRGWNVWDHVNHKRGINFSSVLEYIQDAGGRESETHAQQNPGWCP